MQEKSTHTAVAQRIVDNVSKVIVGKRAVIEHALAALIAQGIKVTTPAPEDVPAWYAMAGQSVDELLESGKVSAESIGLYRKLLQEFRQSANQSGSDSGE